MIFIYNSTDREPQLTKSKIVWRAYKIIITFPTRSSEKLLDSYLRETNKISLKQACLKILYAAKIAYDSSNTYIITFPTEELKKLAQLITYGTGKILGSSILQRAFKKALDTRR